MPLQLGLVLSSFGDLIAKVIETRTASVPNSTVATKPEGGGGSPHPKGLLARTWHRFSVTPRKPGHEKGAEQVL